MFTVQQIRPPGQFQPEGIGEPVIGVRVFVVSDAISSCIYPEHNRIGREILGRLLQARMELAGVRTAEVSQSFPLNRAAYIFTASELAPAQEAIKAELQKLGLLDWAQIAWRDPREEVWRVWHSKSGRFESPSCEEFAVEGKFLDAVTSAAKGFRQSEDEPSRQ